MKYSKSKDHGNWAWFTVLNEVCVEQYQNMLCKNMALMTIIIMVKSGNETMAAIASATQYQFWFTYYKLIPSRSFHLTQPHHI